MGSKEQEKQEGKRKLVVETKIKLFEISTNEEKNLNYFKNIDSLSAFEQFESSLEKCFESIILD